MKNDFVVIDITTNGLDEEAEVVTFAALRFENGVATERFIEYVNIGVILSDNISEILGITNDTVQNYVITIEDAYWQLIEFCGTSEVVTTHQVFDNKFIERISIEYDLPELENNITDLGALFRLKFDKGYSTHNSINRLGITSDETDDWRHLDIAGKTYIELSGEM